MLVSIGHNLRRLLDISGRESRALFWPYVLLLFGLAMIVGFVLMMLPLIEMFARLQRYLIEHPEGFPIADDAAGAKLASELIPDFAAVLVPIAIVNLVFMLLIAAAVARRLHDRDMSGLWGLLPVPFLVAGQAMAPRLFDGASRYPAPDPADFALIALNGALQWVALIALILLLTLEGTNGPNRYGPEPPGES